MSSLFCPDLCSVRSHFINRMTQWSEHVDIVESSGYGAFEAKNNNRHNHFYVPEVEMVIERWQELQYDYKAFALFKDRQLAIASEIMAVRRSSYGDHDYR